MKIPPQVDCLTDKTQLWMNSKQNHLSQGSMFSTLQATSSGFSQRTLKIDKTRLFKPKNTQQQQQLPVIVKQQPTILPKKYADENKNENKENLDKQNKAIKLCQQIFYRYPLTDRSNSNTTTTSNSLGNTNTGIKFFIKKQKTFSFRIYKEEELKIPQKFSTFIERVEDDDETSDEEVVQGGINFNFKAILNGIKQAKNKDH